jgi:predicted ATPase
MEFFHFMQGFLSSGMLGFHCTKNKLAFLRIIWQLEQEGKAQFIIATHSPILMAYPYAVIYSFDHNRLNQITYEETDHYQLTKSFLNNRDKFFRNLFTNDN